MPPAAVMTAQLMCTMGTAPSTLIATNAPTVLIEGKPAGTILDHAPMVNIPPFGTCNILTAAASGVPTPCVPATMPWTPGSTTVLLCGKPALRQGDMCQCAIGGTISIVNPGTVRTMIGG